MSSELDPAPGGSWVKKNSLTMEGGGSRNPVIQTELDAMAGNGEGARLVDSDCNPRGALIVQA